MPKLINAEATGNPIFDIELLLISLLQIVSYMGTLLALQTFMVG